jgi:hypothetical protein
MRYLENARNQANRPQKDKGGEETRLTQPRITRRIDSLVLSRKFEYYRFGNSYI